VHAHHLALKAFLVYVYILKKERQRARVGCLANIHFLEALVNSCNDLQTEAN